MKCNVTGKFKPGAPVKPALLALAVFLLGACQQNAIFDIISKETKPVTALIPGNPTNMVIFNNRLYVGQGETLHSYNSSGWGHHIGNPGGFLRGYALAATDARLYAVASDRLRVYDSGWATVSGGSIQRVFSVKDSNNKWFVFAGKQVDSATYDVYYLEDGASPSLVKLPIPSYNDIFTGAACIGTNVYISTKNGIYSFDSTSNPLASPTTILSGTNIRRMINISSTVIAAVDSKGNVYGINNTPPTTTTVKAVVGTYKQTKNVSLAIWNGASSLLLVGIEDGGYFGYREISLNQPSLNITGSPNEPGGSGSPVSDRDTYISSLRKYPVTDFLQFPAGGGSNGVLFASTVNQGLWSCRNGKWEAEH